MFGYNSKEEMLNIDIKNDLYENPNDRSNIYPEIGYSFLDTYRLKRKDGRIIWVEESAFYVKDESGKVIYHEGIIRDVTKRLKTEAAIKISEKRYRDLVNQSMGYICMHDLNGIILLSNPAGAHALGYEPEEMVGHSLSDYLIPTFARRFNDYLDYLRKGSVFRGLMHVRTKNNEVQIWMHNNVKFEDPGHEPYILCHGQDITELEKSRKEREKLIRELQNAINKVKTLSGLLPICAGCKKIRDDGGYWNQIENYISDHSEAEFSHGMCPECQRKFYPELFKDDELS
jgi:PAS domain S-box-containing protein